MPNSYFVNILLKINNHTYPPYSTTFTVTDANAFKCLRPEFISASEKANMRSFSSAIGLLFMLVIIGLIDICGGVYLEAIPTIT